MRICVTGHRPKLLYGYDLNNEKWQALKEKFKLLLQEEKCTEAITGMALGTDQIFALAVLELKESGKDIKLTCAIPCKAQDSKWKPESRKLYHEILSKADSVVQVSELEYEPRLMQQRNRWMVDHANEVIAVWNGNASGTKNCVDYARNLGKDVIWIDPNGQLFARRLSEDKR